MKVFEKCYICESQLFLNGQGYHDISVPSQKRLICDECYEQSKNLSEVAL